MTALVWGSAPTYETGVDRGVLYPPDGGGVPWNGLISVVEKSIGRDSASFAIDGVTYFNSVTAGTFQATVQAISAPREFGPCVGDLEFIPGFILTKQPKQQFGFSYRTLIGTTGYKLHVVYNITATPTSRADVTINDSPDAATFDWVFDAVPEVTNGYRPSAHYVIDSTKIPADMLANVEALLYGTDTNDPSLPTVYDLVNLMTVDVDAPV